MRLKPFSPIVTKFKISPFYVCFYGGIKNHVRRSFLNTADVLPILTYTSTNEYVIVMSSKRLDNNNINNKYIMFESHIQS